tara:strand:+ start:24 stop:158 length:135 start_codon:yes stop_codon:yes gene_type:complete
VPYIKPEKIHSKNKPGNDNIEYIKNIILKIMKEIKKFSRKRKFI